MKKLEIKEIENINGGVLKCGSVGLLTALSIACYGIGLSYLSDDIVRCWNS